MGRSHTFSRGIPSHRENRVLAAHAVPNSTLFVTRITCLWDGLFTRSGYDTVLEAAFPQPCITPQDIVKLPLISASIVAYTVMAAAWICYAHLVALY
jgi:hypothetical protein